LAEEINVAAEPVRTGVEATGRNTLRERVRQAAIKTESEIIREALDRHRWNRRKTAEALGISYRSLMYKMKNGNLRNSGQGGEALDGEFSMGVS